MDKTMIRNSLICKLINVQESMKENKEKQIKEEEVISKDIKEEAKDIDEVDKRSVLVNVNSEGSGRQKDCLNKMPKVGEDNE